MKDILSKKEFDTLVSLAQRVLWSDPQFRKKIQEHKVNIVPANFYSNIPLIHDIENSFEFRTPGEEVYNINKFDKKQVSDFINSILEYSSEFNHPMDGDFENPKEFFWKNPAFSYSDAMAYYCIVRHFKPNQILEIGSGFSTLVADEALRKNGRGKLTIIEPYPKKFLKSLQTVDNIIEKFVQDIAVNDLVKLIEDSEIWFIDSTHTVKIGSDCLYIYLKVMPEVSKDIIVHSHDIFLPYGYPQRQALDKHIYWTEQYLLYAYMVDNPKIEILFGSAYAVRTMPDLLTKFMGSMPAGGGGSLWYKLKGSLNSRNISSG